MNTIVDIEEFNRYRDPINGKRIQILVSPIRMNFQIGSSESIEFLASLLECTNTDIFKTKFIQTILLDK